MNLADVRERSLVEARRLGYPVNPALPLLDEPTGVRPLRDVLDRCLALHVAVSHAYGFAADRARASLERDGLDSELASAERSLLYDGAGPEVRARVQASVEALWVLAWSVGAEGPLDFGSWCPDDLVLRMPNLKEEESPAAFRARASLRAPREIVKSADLAYCLHWAATETRLHGRPLPGPLDGGAIANRRLALDWLLGDGCWDEIPLDT